MSAVRQAQAAAEPQEAPRYLLWWLLLGLIFEYARPSGFVPALGIIPLNSLLPMSLLLMCFIAKGLRPWEEIKKDAITKWIFIYFGLIVVSVPVARVSLYAWTVMITTLGYVIYWFLVARITTSFDKIRGIFATLIVAHLFLLVMNPEAVTNPTQRHYIKGGTFLGDGNDFSLSVCILLPMAIDLALSAKSKLIKILWWTCLLLLALAIIGSSSRGGTLGMAAVIFYLWLRSRRKGLGIVGVIVLATVVLIYAPDTYFNRMSTMASYQEDGSAMGRINAWKSAVRMYVDNPILGVGAGNFPNSFGTTYKPPGVDNIKWKTAHSMYFLVLGELATPGIVTFLVLVIGNMRMNTAMRRKVAAALPKEASPGAGPATKPAQGDAQAYSGLIQADRMLYLLNASMLGFAVSGAFLSVAYYPHIFILTGLMLATRHLARRELAAVTEGAQVEAPAPARKVRSFGMMPGRGDQADKPEGAIGRARPRFFNS